VTAAPLRPGRDEAGRGPARPLAGCVVVAYHDPVSLVSLLDRLRHPGLPVPEDYFLYWEESDWFWRLHRAGARVQYRPDVEVVHCGGRSEVRPDKSRLLSRNAVRCVLLTQGRLAAAAALVVVVAWNLRLAATALARSLRPGRMPGTVAARFAGLASSVRAVDLLVAARPGRRP